MAGAQQCNVRLQVPAAQVKIFLATCKTPPNALGSWKLPTAILYSMRQTRRDSDADEEKRRKGFLHEKLVSRQPASMVKHPTTPNHQCELSITATACVAPMTSPDTKGSNGEGARSLE
mmetsp:Transcript_14691/g.50156  ORF Transcript_14691/g.50156 Transcript_14691/m.50156 type:complete len:118 (-) Transcript_14691:597-950(-)